jgi:hypothetical protein
MVTDAKLRSAKSESAPSVIARRRSIPSGLGARGEVLSLGLRDELPICRDQHA